MLGLFNVKIRYFVADASTGAEAAASDATGADAGAVAGVDTSAGAEASGADAAVLEVPSLREQAAKVRPITNIANNFFIPINSFKNKIHNFK